jgi:hypothetical protein
VQTADEDELRRQRVSAAGQRFARLARRSAAAVTALAVAAVAAVVVLTATGCGVETTGGGPASGGPPEARAGETDRICPAIDHGRTLVVQLADGWPAAEGRTVVVRCEEPCGRVQRDRDEPTHDVSGALAGSIARLPMMAVPESVVVTVLDPGGAVAEVAESLTWRRVGGTEECGGPMEAVVLVPAG